MASQQLAQARDRQREMLAGVVAKELTKAGADVSEISDWQKRIASPTSTMADVVKGLMDVKAKYPSFDSGKLDSFLLIAGSEVIGEQETHKAEIDPMLITALSPVIDGSAGNTTFLIPFGPKYSYGQLKRMLSVIFEDYVNTESGLQPDELKLAFVISNETKIHGSIICKQDESRKAIPLVSVYLDIKSKGYKYMFFGESKSQYKGHPLIATYALPFNIYRFISDDNEEYYLLSKDELAIEGCTIEGMSVPLIDAVKVTQIARVLSQAKVFFVFAQTKDQIELDGTTIWEAVKDWTTLDIIAAKFFGKYPQPDWFKKFIVGWLFSKKLAKYPTHIAMLSDPGMGKTSLMESLEAALDADIIGGGTIKGLVPSFAMGRPEPGYLLRCRRLALVDEFVHIITHSYKKQDKGDFDGGSSDMLKILEHSQDAYSSAYGSIKGKPRMWCLFCSNIKPHERVSNLVDLHSKLNVAFMSRMFWYIMDDEHNKYINDHKAEVMAQQDEQEDGSDPLVPKYDPSVVSVVDYMRTAKADGITPEVVDAIYNYGKPAVPAELMTDIYDSRMKLHIHRLLDGFVKVQSILYRRGSFTLLPCDVDEFKEIFLRCVSSWSRNVSVDKLPMALRVNYLGPEQREVFEIVKSQQGITSATLATLKTIEAVNLARLLVDRGMLQVVKNGSIGGSEGDMFYTYSWKIF